MAAFADLDLRDQTSQISFEIDLGNADTGRPLRVPASDSVM